MVTMRNIECDDGLLSITFEQENRYTFSKDYIIDKTREELIAIFNSKSIMGDRAKQEELGRISSNIENIFPFGEEVTTSLRIFDRLTLAGVVFGLIHGGKSGE